MTPEPNQDRIADLHCHYPMRVSADTSKRAVAVRRACSGDSALIDHLRAFAILTAARLLNFQAPWTSWRVTFRGLEQGGAGLVLSVLYDPVYELLVMPGKQRPRATAFKGLLCQLRCVEADLAHADPDEVSHRIVRSRAQLEETLASGRMAFVHCVEGGLHLGDDVNDVEENIAVLDEKGVAYVTLAHLFYRGVASNAPALPVISDRCYDLIFRHRERGLSDLGRAVVTAMYERNMLVDVTHMDAPALEQTFALLDELDERHGADPTDHPVIASHAGYRFGDLHYMLDAETIEQVARRGGVIGLILAKHQLQDGFKRRELRSSRFYALERHIRKIHEITGSHKHTCIGSDHDGFIKPTVSQIQRSRDLAEIGRWLRAHDDFAGAADDILYGNAERVVATALR